MLYPDTQLPFNQSSIISAVHATAGRWPPQLGCHYMPINMVCSIGVHKLLSEVPYSETSFVRDHHSIQNIISELNAYCLMRKHLMRDTMCKVVSQRREYCHVLCLWINYLRPHLFDDVLYRFFSRTFLLFAWFFPNLGNHLKLKSQVLLIVSLKSFSRIKEKRTFQHIQKTNWGRIILTKYWNKFVK